MTTLKGSIKKTPLKDFENVRRTGIIALKLKSDDSLRWVSRSSGQDDIILVTRDGQSIRFSEKDVRPMGRTAAGVTAIRLKKTDLVAGMELIHKDGEINKNSNRILTVMEHGFGKQTPLKEYKVQKRGGSGIKTAKVTDRTGPVIDARVVSDENEEIIAFSSKGQAIRANLKDVRIAGRDTQGVKIMNLDAGDSLTAIVCL